MKKIRIHSISYSILEYRIWQILFTTIDMDVDYYVSTLILSFITFLGH